MLARRRMRFLSKTTCDGDVCMLVSTLSVAHGMTQMQSKCTMTCWGV